MAVPKRTGDQVGSAAHDETSSDSCDRGTADVLCPRRQGTRRRASKRSNPFCTASWAMAHSVRRSTGSSISSCRKETCPRSICFYERRDGRAYHERRASLRQRAARDRRTGGHAGRGISVVFGQRQRNAAGPPRHAAAQPVLRRQRIDRHALQRHLGLRGRRARVRAAGQQLRPAHHRRDESGRAVPGAVHRHVGRRDPPKGRIWRDVDINLDPVSGKTYAYIGAQANGNSGSSISRICRAAAPHGVNSNPIPAAEHRQPRAHELRPHDVRQRRVSACCS